MTNTTNTMKNKARKALEAIHGFRDGYQHNYSSAYKNDMHNEKSRSRKAGTMLAVINDFIEEKLPGHPFLSILEIGSSTGYIGNRLSEIFTVVRGVDIDSEAVDYANKHNGMGMAVSFQVGDAMALDFDDGSFDWVMCSHVYEHVPDASILMAEIARVLKPGGVCYFVAGNRLNFWEQHYNLPLLSVIPRALGHWYVRLTGRAPFYYEKHLSYWGLKSLVKDFTVHDYTRKIANDPVRFGADYMLAPCSFKAKMARFVANHLYWLFPTYVWLLQKPGQPANITPTIKPVIPLEFASIQPAVPKSVQTSTTSTVLSSVNGVPDVASGSVSFDVVFNRQQIELRIKAELRDPFANLCSDLNVDTQGSIGQHNFYMQVQAVASLIKQYSGDNNDIRLRQGAAAQYGGIVKKWRRFLIETITAEVWSGRETSRDVVRDWQQKVFGQSIKASRLKAYGHPERSGEGRPKIDNKVCHEIPNEIERDAADIYESYREAIKLVFPC